MPDRGPKIVCLCGSTRFKEEYLRAAYEYTMQGWIVLTVHAFAHADGISYTEDEKADLDILHLRKIDLADDILIISVDGYIGDSTLREISYARSHGKGIRRWEPTGPKEGWGG